MNRARGGLKANAKAPRGNNPKPRPPKGTPSNVAKRPIPPFPSIEEEEEEIPEATLICQEQEPKPKEDSWLNHLLPVIKPDEELHQQLSQKRKEQHYQKIKCLCERELDGILNYSFDFMKQSQKDQNFINSSKYRSLRTKFRNGFFTPEPNSLNLNSEKLSTLVEPSHTLAIQHYLHFQSDSYLDDLSCALGVKISDKYIEDPNPLFNDFIKKIFASSQVFIDSYHPYDILPFPFIVCIGGLIGGGKTTVTQFLQKSFDAHFIEVKPLHQDGGKKQKKQTQDIETIEELPDYPLSNSILLKYSDDKTAVQMIVNAIEENMDGRGFVIDGYPNNKNQFSALDKALNAAGINMAQFRNNKSNKPPLSARSKAVLPIIDGVIIALNNDGDRARLLDPETGNIYKKDFHMPGLPDLIGVLPINFVESKSAIEKRLIEINVPEIPILAPKAMTAYSQFEGMVKKTASVALIKQTDDIVSLLKVLDTFLVSLYEKFPNVLPQTSPMTTLVRPTCLVMPGLCFNSLTTWYKCIEHFGRTIADQSNLVSTLDNKLDVIMKAGTERYQLLIGQKDERLTLCNEFMKNKGSMNMAQHFRKIWDLSLKIRNQNLEHIDEVVGRSGLVELLVELRKSPKIVFTALVQKMLYIKWFFETFVYIETMSVDENTESPFFKTLDVEKVDTPIYFLTSKQPNIDMISSRKSESEIPVTNSHIPILDLQYAVSMANFPQSAKIVKPPETSRPQSPRNHPLTSRRSEESEKKERRMMANLKGFDYLVENLNYFCEKPQDTVFFDLTRTCAILNVLPFEIRSSFDDTAHYAEEFFANVAKHTDNPLILNEAKSSLSIFNRFMKLCKTKEAFMVNSVFDLRDSLNNYTFAKCTHEMEYFARQFRLLKQSQELKKPLFEYDVNHVCESIKKLATCALSFDTPIIAQNLVSPETTKLLGREICARNLFQASGDDLINVLAECGVNEEEQMRFEYCMRIFECVEHFDVRSFLLCFSHNREDEIILMNLFKDKEDEANSAYLNMNSFPVLNENIETNTSKENKTDDFTENTEKLSSTFAAKEEPNTGNCLNVC